MPAIQPQANKMPTVFTLGNLQTDNSKHSNFIFLIFNELMHTTKKYTH